MGCTVMFKNEAEFHFHGPVLSVHIFEVLFFLGVDYLSTRALYFEI